jgi:two-component system chemotaxis response regulator CheB
MLPYRILVVDDSAFMRKFVSDIIAGDDTFLVIGSARNGREAIEAIKQHRPDAVTLDVEMPVMTGLEALPVIMKEAPTPIVMMSSSTHEGAAATFQALELGAFDFVAKPSGPLTMGLDRVQESLLETLRAAVAGKKEDIMERLQLKAPPPVLTPLSLPQAPPMLTPLRPKPAARKPIPSPESRVDKPLPPRKFDMPETLKKQEKLNKPEKLNKQNKQNKLNKSLEQAQSPKPAGYDKPPASVPAPKKQPAPTNKLVAIGTSTGGPRALQQVLTRLPADFPAPILVVQHMPPGFTKSLAQRLNTLCAIGVLEAEDGMEPVPGRAYIAPGGLHMSLRKEAGKFRLRLSSDPSRSGHRPSVDTLFESLAVYPELDRLGVLMPGMGSDGAKGMKLLFDQGVRKTIAEDQSSCIVYGMPRAAVELGCVTRVVPLDSLASQITKAATQAEEV